MINTPARGTALVLATWFGALGACTDREAAERLKGGAYHRGNALRSLEAGDYSAALLAAEQAVEYNPMAPGLQDLLRRVRLTAIANSPTAVRVDNAPALLYQARAMLDRDSARAHIYETARGFLLLSQGDVVAARAAFKSAVGHDSKSAGAQIGLAECMARQGDLPGAVVSLEKARASIPDSPDLLLQLGVLLTEQNQLSQAIAVLQEVVEARPSALGHMRLARALSANEQSQMAGAHYESAAKTEPRNADAHAQFARWLLVNDQLDAAEREFKQVSDLGQKPLGAYGVGLVQLQRGNHEEAAKLFDESYRADPRLHGAVYHAARAHEAAGDAKGAVSLYTRYIDAAGQQASEEPTVDDARRRLEALQQASPKAGEQPPQVVGVPTPAQGAGSPAP